MYLKQKKESKKEITKYFFEYIENESEDISYDLFKDHFNFVAPTVLAKELFKTEVKNKNNESVKLSKVKLSNLKDEI